MTHVEDPKANPEQSAVDVTEELVDWQLAKGVFETFPVHLDTGMLDLLPCGLVRSDATEPGQVHASPTLFGGSLAVYGREEADPIVGGRRSWPPLVGSDLLFDVLLDD